jgi:hypothetical protein
MDTRVLPIRPTRTWPRPSDPCTGRSMRSSLILPPASVEPFYSATAIPDADQTLPGDVPLFEDDSPTERFTRDDMPTWPVTDS